jgi:tRNA(Ile)-lysidine synthase
MPVDVTGIQPRGGGRVRDAATFQYIREARKKESFAPKDFGALDLCDKHGQEGTWGDRRELIERRG